MRVIAATGNEKKALELTRILEPYGITAVTMKAAGFSPEIEETGATFAENALIKARALYALSGEATVADDSGLCVDALGGRPGVYSARYGGAELDYPSKMARLLGELEGVPREKRTARFVSVIAFIDREGREHLFEGVCEGWVGFEPQGEHGFGYDPLFYVGERSYAQLSDEEKDALSHRGKALRALAQAVAEGRVR